MRFSAVRRHLLLVAVVLTAAIAFPIGVIASHQFTDVPASSTFHDDIDAIRDAGVTTGCAVGKYCPKDFVTREQMAAFLNRLGALGSGKTPVVNATKLDGRDSTDFLGLGPIVVQHLGPWQRSNGGLSEPWTGGVMLGFESTGAGGSNDWYLPIAGPTAIDGLAYGLDSVRVCLQGPFNPYVAAMQINRIVGGLSGTVAIDSGPHNSGCFSVAADPNDGTDASYLIVLHVDYPGSTGALFIQTVHVTWAPVG